MERDVDVLNTVGKFIVNASVKSEVDVLMHHLSGVYASCRKFHGLNTTTWMLASGKTLYHWIHLSTINTGDIFNHDKRSLSSPTSLVYQPLRAAAMLGYASCLKRRPREHVYHIFITSCLRHCQNVRHFMLWFLVVCIQKIFCQF